MRAFGLAHVAIPRGRAAFHCPICGKGRTCRVLTAVGFFFVGWVPTIPVRSAGTYFECTTCQMTYRKGAVEPEAYRAIRIIIAHSLSRQQTTMRPSDMQRVLEVYQELTGRPLPQKLVQKSIDEVKGRDLVKQLRREFPYMNARGVCLCLYAGFMLAADDGRLEDWEQRVLIEIADGFFIPLAAAALILQNVQNGVIPTPHLEAAAAAHA